MKPIRSRAALRLSLVLGAALGNSLSSNSWASPADSACELSHVRLDPAIWNIRSGTFLGRAVGQTFFAPETLISSLTVWRPPNQPSAVGVHLFVTEVDTQLARPQANPPFFDGPTIIRYDSDPPGQLIEMRFVLEPPLALPHRGLYAFFLQAAGCWPGEINFIANNTNPYPHGIHWITGRVEQPPPCYLRGVDRGNDSADILFDIEFCGSGSTPTLPTSWGRLKVIYR